jgi:hypothetical protein
MKTKHLKGELRPTNPGSVKFNTAQYIYKALMYNNLSRAIYNDSKWDKGIIQVDTKFGAPGGEVVEKTLTKEALKIINDLAEFVKAERVAELSLEGTITLTFEDSQTLEVNTVRITVSKGKVTYQQAAYVWNGVVTV